MQPTVYSRLERCAVDDNGEFYMERDILPIEGTLMLLKQFSAEQGLDTIRTMESIDTWSEDFDYFSGSIEKTVPGKKDLHEKLAKQKEMGRDVRYFDGMDVTPEPSDIPVSLSCRLVILDGIAFAGVNASPYSGNYEALKDRLPFETTILFDDCFGCVSSIPTPEAEEQLIYAHSTLQSRFLTSRLGTNAFLSSFDELLEKYIENRLKNG